MMLSGYKHMDTTQYLRETKPNAQNVVIPDSGTSQSGATNTGTYAALAIGALLLFLLIRRNAK